jgi:DNA polymerase III alpha subunit
MLLEDERGNVNLVIPKHVFERERALVRSAVMVRARGRLERREGVVNVLVERIAELERKPTTRARPPAPRLREDREPEPSTSPAEARALAVAELRAVAPAGHSFGRRGR